MNAVTRNWWAVVGLAVGSSLGLAPIRAGEFAPRSLAYVVQFDSLATNRAGTVSKLAVCGRDLIVMDTTYDESLRGAWTRQEVAAIRKAQVGRKVVAYLCVGEAEDFRDYWRKEWDANNDGKPDPGAPAFLDIADPDYEGDYRVRYWQAQWQQIVLRNVDKVIDQDFDGIYMDMVDAFDYYEYDQTRKDWIENCENPETHRTYRQDMLAFLKSIAAHARGKKPAFLIIPQNGSELLADPEYVRMIDAIGIEDLFTDGDKPQPKEDVQEVLQELRPLKEAKKPVLDIEYAGRSMRQMAIEGAGTNGFLLLFADPELKTLGTCIALPK